MSRVIGGLLVEEGPQEGCPLFAGDLEHHHIVLETLEKEGDALWVSQFWEGRYVCSHPYASLLVLLPGLILGCLLLLKRRKHCCLHLPALLVSLAVSAVSFRALGQLLGLSEQPLFFVCGSLGLLPL